MQGGEQSHRRGARKGGRSEGGEDVVPALAPLFARQKMFHTFITQHTLLTHEQNAHTHTNRISTILCVHLT